MKHLQGKMKFLAVKLSALQSELKVSREILQNASREVDKMFTEKYFPEQPVVRDEEPKVPVAPGDDFDKDSEPHDEQPSADPGTEKSNHPSGQDLLDRMEHEKKDIDPEVKKIFRKIALKIHPDKLEKLEDGFEKSKKLELYQKAIAAMEREDLIILADIAIELGLDPPEITEQKLKQTEAKIIAIKKELAHIESTIVWQWFFCSNKEQKDNILTRLFEIMYANNPRA